MNALPLQQIFSHFQLILLLVTAILHAIFASGVARDIGNLHRLGLRPWFIPGSAWVMTVLVFGLLAMFAYWLMHHSSLSRAPKIIKERDEYS